jgi:hypothetical protein
MFLEDNAAHPVGCDSQLKIVMAIRRTFFSLKVHKIENFFDSDFGICVISLLVMSKY